MNTYVKNTALGRFLLFTIDNDIIMEAGLGRILALFASVVLATSIRGVVLIVRWLFLIFLSLSTPLKAMDDKDKIVNILENQNELKKISYPISMIEKKLDGRCIARFRLNEDGSARNIVIVQSLGQAFDSEVIEGIKRMRFKPVRPEGVFVSNLVYEMPIHFKNK